MKSANALLIALPLLLCGGLASAQDGPGPEAGEEQAQRVERLVRQLGHPSFAQREAAQKELVAIGRPALAALRRAAGSDDPEVASRAAEAIEAIGGAPDRTREREAPPEQRRGPELPQPLDPNQVLEGLQKQLPERFGKLFKELFGEDMFGGGKDQDGTGRVRVWSWGKDGQGGWRSLDESAAARLGVNVTRAGAAMRAQLDLAPGTGLVVNRVDGHAAAHGVQLYDVIAAIDGRPAQTAEDLTPLLAKGGRVELVRRAKRVVVQLPAVPGGEEAQPERQAPPQRRAPPAPEPKDEEKAERDF